MGDAIATSWFGLIADKVYVTAEGDASLNMALGFMCTSCGRNRVCLAICVLRAVQSQLISCMPCLCAAACSGWGMDQALSPPSTSAPRATGLALSEDADMESIRSFSAETPTAGSPAPRGPAGGGAWSSPAGTLKGQQHGGSGAGSAAQRPAAGGWNDSIRSLRSVGDDVSGRNSGRSAAGGRGIAQYDDLDEIESFGGMDSPQDSLRGMRPAVLGGNGGGGGVGLRGPVAVSAGVGPTPMRLGGPGGGVGAISAGTGTRVLQRSSFDSVSDVSDI